MGKLKAYFFLVIVTVFTFSQVLVVASFLSNRTFIAKNLCENIDRPELECNGKCFLMKKLKEDEEQKSTDQSVSAEVIFFLNHDQISVNIQKQFIEERQSVFAESAIVLDGYSISIFHPPILTT